MKQGLKIYACSGLEINNKGVGTAAPDFNYWFDNTSSITNTIAVNNLLTKINLLFAQLQYDPLTDEEIISALNLIDLYTVCLQFAKQYHGAELEKAGNVVAKMLADNMFDYTSWDNDERDDNLDSLIEKAFDIFNGNAIEHTTESKFHEWFKSEVIDKDYCGLSKEQQEKLAALCNNQGVSGEEYVSTGDPATDLSNSGAYYLYCYMRPNVAKNVGKQVVWKRNKENEVLKYVHRGYDQVFGAEGVNNLISIGVRKRYNKTPEDVIEILTNTQAQGIGDIATFIAVCQAIVAVGAIIEMVVKFILNCVGVCLEGKYASPPNVEAGTPGWGEEDIAELEAAMKDGKNLNSTNYQELLKYGVIGLVILMILK